jgi:hypothetical protein
MVAWTPAFTIGVTISTPAVTGFIPRLPFPDQPLYP